MVTDAQPRRRVTVATAVLRRVQVQARRFAVDYAQATTPQQRFATAVSALRAAAAPGRHQVNTDDVAYRLNHLTTEIVTLLEHLHAQQQAAAHTVIRAEQRRVERNERRRCDRGTRTSDQPDT